MSANSVRGSERSRQAGDKRRVPVSWEALEDAFENNAPEVHSYLQLNTGEVIRIVDGIADPGMHSRIMADPSYLRIDPVSSREQYRWMERFVATVEESDLRQKLLSAIDGKGAFRRFKDVLMHFPVDRERWFTFRSERLRVSMLAWLEANDIEATERDQWEVPSADDVREAVAREESERPERRNRAAAAEAVRKRLMELAASLPVRELDAAVAFLEFLRERRHLPRVTARRVERQQTADQEDAGNTDDGPSGSDSERSG